ncbi:MAG TPA: hypothetical protein VGK02_09655 [Candidatus Aquicultor sp.]
MIIRSKDKKTSIIIGEVAGFEVMRDRIYPPGQETPVAGFTLAAVMARYDSRIPMGGYESEDEAVAMLRSIEAWIEQGGRGIFEVA